MCNAHNEMNKLYRKLKKDYMADEVKKLYSEGVRMKSSPGARLMLREMFIDSGILIIANTMLHLGADRTTSARMASFANIGANVTNTYIYAKQRFNNKKLSAYYAY